MNIYTDNSYEAAGDKDITTGSGLLFSGGIS